MNLSTIKNFTHKAKDYTSFYTENNEPRVNVEGVVQVANSDGEPLDSFGGGGGAGGGSIVYTNAAGDFVATITNATKNITITGLPFTLEAINVIGGSIKVIHATTNEVEDIVITSKTVSVSGGVITLSEADNFVTGDVVLVTLIGPDKAYDVALDQQLVAVQNPNYAHTTSVETLISETNIDAIKGTADDTAASDTDTISETSPTGTFTNANTAIGYTAYQTTAGATATVNSASTTVVETTTLTAAATWRNMPYSVPLVKRYEINADTYNFLTLHYRLRATTNCTAYFKIYGTLDATATVDDDTNWVNLSSSLLGSSSGLTLATGAATLEDLIIIDTPSTMLKYMIKLVIESNTASAATNTFTVFVKKSS